MHDLLHDRAPTHLAVPEIQLRKVISDQVLRIASLAPSNDDALGESHTVHLRVDSINGWTRMNKRQLDRPIHTHHTNAEYAVINPTYSKASHLDKVPRLTEVARVEHLELSLERLRQLVLR
jgi:hypothetical protein